nr:hypothetical protein FFPRI1PSEUD_24570 [Pseudomonas sp. FFPRI_1]
MKMGTRKTKSGALFPIGALVFSYDAADQLLRESSSTGNLAYHYDALGRRIAKAVTQSGQSQETRFLRQGLRLILPDIDSSRWKHHWQQRRIGHNSAD